MLYEYIFSKDEGEEQLMMTGENPEGWWIVVVNPLGCDLPFHAIVSCLGKIQSLHPALERPKNVGNTRKNLLAHFTLARW